MLLYIHWKHIGSCIESTIIIVYEKLVVLNFTLLMPVHGYPDSTRYVVSGKPNSFCSPSADGFVGAANLLTVSKNQVG